MLVASDRWLVFGLHDMLSPKRDKVMTQARIAEGLLMLVIALSDTGTGTLIDPPNGWETYEWAYIKGLAAGAILQSRRQLTLQINETTIPKHTGQAAAL